jgi:hypothetical protein
MEISILNLRRWFLIIFALSCLGLNLIAYVLYKKNQEVVLAKDWVVHTYAVVAETENLFSQLQDIEPPPIKESSLDSDFAIHKGTHIGGILDGTEVSYGGTDYREVAPG